MASIYGRADIYDLIEDEGRDALYQRHWEAVLENRPVKTLLDVSIGTGGVTLPLARRGVRLSGSGLGEAMLARCQSKADARGVAVRLRRCDFRAAAEGAAERFGCVASTGNSLPYVPADGVMRALEQMDALARPGGWLYFDTRNWDKILRERKRFYLCDPFFRDGVRVNFTQVWDYEADGSMTFHLLYTFERDGHIFRREKFEEHYFPIAQKALLDKLRALGYRAPRVLPFPAGAGDAGAEGADWYCVLAQKP